MPQYDNVVDDEVIAVNTEQIVAIRNTGAHAWNQRCAVLMAGGFSFELEGSIETALEAMGLDTDQTSLASSYRCR